MSYPSTVKIGWWIANQCLLPLGPVQRFPPDLPIGIVSGYIINPNGMINKIAHQTSSIYLEPLPKTYGWELFDVRGGFHIFLTKYLDFMR